MNGIEYRTGNIDQRMLKYKYTLLQVPLVACSQKLFFLCEGLKHSTERYLVHERLPNFDNKWVLRISSA